MVAPLVAAGRGATFHVTVKLPAAALPHGHECDFIGAQPALDGLRLLVADDNATNSRVLALQTGKWGPGVRCGHHRHAHAGHGRAGTGACHPQDRTQVARW